MNTLLLVLLLTAADAPIVPLDGIIHVRRGLSQAHACAVRADILLTASHVVDSWGSVAWGDLSGTGRGGTAITIYTDPARDLAMLKIERGVPGKVWPLAKFAPPLGAQVLIVGYDDNDVMKPKVIKAKIIAIDAGHIDYSRSPGPGSSGDCVLYADEVVAINYAYNPKTWRGSGVSVYGEWGPDLDAVPVEAQ